jgi:hypothetical protein
MGHLSEWLQLMLAEIASRQQAARAAEQEDACRGGVVLDARVRGDKSSIDTTQRDPQHERATAA